MCCFIYPGGECSGCTPDCSLRLIPYPHPQMVVELEDGNPISSLPARGVPSDDHFLCSLDARGVHPNWAQISLMSRDDFVKQAGKLMKQLDTVQPTQRSSTKNPGWARRLGTHLKSNCWRAAQRVGYWPNPTDRRRQL
jgi:hypothetical protein